MAKSARDFRTVACLAAAATLWLAPQPRLGAQGNQPIYTDSLQNGWQNWGWATINYANTNPPVHSGSDSIAVTITTNNSQAIYIAHTAFDSTPYGSLTFWINGGSAGGQQLLVQGHAGGTAQATTNLPPLAANSWQQYTISLARLGCANRPDMDGFWIQDRIGAVQPTFYVDDITLLTNGSSPSTNSFAISVDAQLNRRPISPLIYGIAFADSNQLAGLNFTVNRSGGNAETRNNWRLNAHNHAADWYFESLDDSPGVSLLPGATGDDFVANSKSGGASPILTISMIGWAPKLGPSRGKLSSYSIAKYGPQTGNDWQYMPDAGNGVGTNTAAQTSWLITTNDPTDANFATNSTFQAAWLAHLTNAWGTATNGGVSFYCMDNEESIWFSTQRDVHPVGPTMQEIRDKFFDYAGQVKAVDPKALVLAPEEWGWSGYFYSGYDQQNPGYTDRNNNGGWDYCPWLLNQFYQRATNTNQRLLDYFTLHCYPQGGEYGSDVSSSTQLLRNRSTRQLWDSNYVDASWIGQQPTNNILMLIPRMLNWVNTGYPGTKIGITEYNWGAEGHMNGATAQADLLGIFGREGLDLATRWASLNATDLVYKAMQMYRNYDGNKSTFGDTSISASGPNPDYVSTFAAVRSLDGALTLMVINKQLTANAAVIVGVTNFLSTGSAQVWQLTVSNSISRLNDLVFAGNSFTDSVPAQSITLFVLSAANAPRLQAGSASPGNTFDFWLEGQAGERYVVQSSTDLRNWTPILTNTLSSNSWHITLSTTNFPRQFLRGKWAP